MSLHGYYPPPHTRVLPYYAVLLLFSVTAMGADFIPCSQTVNSLGDILTTVDMMPNFTMCVNMPPGRHYLNYTSFPITYNVILAGNNSTIECDPLENETTLPRNIYSRFPFTFQNSSFVSIENVHFEKCLRPLRFIEVLEITLVNATFSDFSPGGAVEISNSPQVIVESCTFTNNTSQGIGQTPYSGNAGGIAVGYSDTQFPARLQECTPQINISRSQFEKNRALAGDGFQYSVAEIISKRVYNQRGGGIACYLGTPNSSTKITIDQCVIAGNVASSAGGGLYVFLTGENNTHQVNITRTEFIRNNAPDGGGLEITFDTDVSVERPNWIFITDCNFTGNIGNLGGGFKSIQINSEGNLNYINISNSSFSENEAPVGSALYFQSRYTVSSVSQKKRIFLEDCMFVRNEANRGVVFLIQNTVVVMGTSIFRENTGPSIRVVDSLLTMQGDVWFVNNRRHQEGFSGALYLSSFGQLLLHNGTNITFINNTGSEGACIVAKSQTITAGFTKQLYNPQCFLLYENPEIPPPQWKVNMKFTGNKAVVGPVMYLSNLDACQWYSNESPFFSLDRDDVWSFMQMNDNSVIRGSEELSLPDHNIQTDIHELHITDNQTSVLASPGDLIEVGAVALDQLGHETSAFLDIAVKFPIDSEDIVFLPSIVQTQAGVGEIEFTYRSENRKGNTTVMLNPSFTVKQVPAGEVILVRQECLPGYSPSEDECVCEETDKILLCDPNREGVLLANGLWGAPPSWSRTLVTYPCPPGYCNCNGGASIGTNGSEGCLLLYSDPYHICHEKREGVLCGQCREGYGVGALTNNCRRYTGDFPEYYVLIPLYVLIVIPLLVLIVKTGLKLPTVLKGFLLYIQISPTAVEYLPDSFRLQAEIVDCIESTLALYLPYDFSLHAGLTALESYGLRLTTPLIAVILVPFVIKIRYRSKSWRGLWTLILLMYTRTVETCISLVFCPTLERRVDGKHISTTVWFYDGNVECYHGAHLGLAIVAILALVSLGLFIPLVIMIIYHDWISGYLPRFDRLERCSLAVTRGLKKEYKWWPVVELMTRYLFVVAVTLSPGYKSLPLLLTVVILSMHSFVHPYKSRVANYSESLVMLVLVIILALGNTTVLVEATTDVKKFTLAPLLFLPILVGGIITTVYIGHKIRKWISRHKETIKKKLHIRSTKTRISSENRGNLTLSFRRVWDTNITRTSVSLFDDDSDSDDSNSSNDNSEDIIASDQ